MKEGIGCRLSVFLCRLRAVVLGVEQAQAIDRRKQATGEVQDCSL